MHLIKQSIRFHKENPRQDLKKLNAQRREVQNNLAEKLGAAERESGNAEVKSNNNKNVLGIVSDLVDKFENRARKPLITQETISKMEGRRKWNNVYNEEGKKNCRRIRNELTRATENA
jgi:hypothetical protein